MQKFLRRMSSKPRRGEKGFTLIELLIVVAILGILAAVIIPNVSTFMVTGRLNAANTEEENIKTASLAYYAENGFWPAKSDEAAFANFVAGTPKAVYQFDDNATGNTGFILRVDSATVWGAHIGFQAGSTTGHGKWIRTP